MNRFKNFFKHGRLLLYIIVPVVLLITGFLLYSGVKLGVSATSSWWTPNTKPTSTPPPSTYNLPSPSPTDHCRGPWDVHELDIPAGGLPIQLCWGWSFWPVNGPVTLTTKSGKVYKFLPNKEGEIVIPELQMGGMAIFRGDPDGSTRRIAVKNRW